MATGKKSKTTASLKPDREELVAYMKKSFIRRSVAAVCGLITAAALGYIGSKKSEK
jgi:hypothetical protein